jgi:hypothetical protein
MRPVYLVVTGVGVSTPVIMDAKKAAFNIGVGCVIQSGTATFTLQHTYDDVTVPGWSGATANWFNNANVSNAVVSTDTAYTGRPIRALRLNVTVSSGGTVLLQVIQGSTS